MVWTSNKHHLFVKNHLVTAFFKQVSIKISKEIETPGYYFWGELLSLYFVWHFSKDLFGKLRRMGTIFEENICHKLFLLFFWSKTEVFSKTTVNPYQKNSNMENSLGWVLLLGGGGKCTVQKKNCHLIFF